MDHLVFVSTLSSRPPPFHDRIHNISSISHHQGEQSKLEASIFDKEKTADELAQKIGKMQSMLQQTTADAVNAIAAQHHAGG
jgi:hypothetical protein